MSDIQTFDWAKLGRELAALLEPEQAKWRRRCRSCGRVMQLPAKLRSTVIHKGANPQLRCSCGSEPRWHDLAIGS